MILSAVAMNTNAETTPSNTANLEIRAEFLKPMNLINEQYLGFGAILADEGNKTVIVKADGSFDDSSSATMMSKKSFTNYATSGRTALGSLNEGVIRAKGFLNDERDGYDPMSSYTPEVLNYLVSVNISDTSVELKNYTDSITCGTVSAFTTNITKEGNDALIHVGGTLTTADLSGTGSSLQCRGHTTITLVYNEDNFAAYQNSQLNGN